MKKKIKVTHHEPDFEKDITQDESHSGFVWVGAPLQEGKTTYTAEDGMKVFKNKTWQEEIEIHEEEEELYEKNIHHTRLPLPYVMKEGFLGKNSKIESMEIDSFSLGRCEGLSIPDDIKSWANYDASNIFFSSGEDD